MRVKLSITTKCNAECITCPVWEYPGQNMKYNDFTLIWDKINFDRRVTYIMLNNTGDMYNHPDRMKIFKYIEEHLTTAPVAMTTNAGMMDYVPQIDQIFISFNGGNKESYEYTTGLDFEETVSLIRSHYSELEKIPNVEMHCLIYEGNEGCEKDFTELWSDFPGRLRFSYKYDNQGETDYTLDKYKTPERIPCDYLYDIISIMPDGKVVSCAHDFEQSTDYGNILLDDMETIIFNRLRWVKIEEHKKGHYTGICENCNYNTGDSGRIVYAR